MYQSITLIGNLGDKPTMRYTPSGKAVTSFSMAISERKDQPAIWFKVSCWEKLAELTDQYLDKGSKIMVVGKMELPRPYTNKAGEPACSLEVTAREIKFLDSRKGGDNEANATPVADDGSIPF